MTGPKSILTLFDLPQPVSPRPALVPVPAGAPTPSDKVTSDKVHSVTEIARLGKALLERNFPNVWVQGEVAELNRNRSGHWYFTLKDGACVLKAVMFSSAVVRARVDVQPGMKVVAGGKITLYEPQGTFQLQVEHLRLTGAGAAAAALEALKRKLEGEGLFAAARKKELPKHPRVVGVVTSLDGAALHDILNVLRQRAPHVHVLVCSARVQGQGAAGEVATALLRLDASRRVDVIVVGRGGGSSEDLLAFHDEALVRAVAACKTPIISAVGHETDVTLVDFAADARAPTPSAAAALAVPLQAELLRTLAQLLARMARAVAGGVQAGKLRLLRLQAQLPEGLALVNAYAQRLDDLEARAMMALRQRVHAQRVALGRWEAQLAAAHPVARVRSQRVHLNTLHNQAVSALRHIQQAQRAQQTRLTQRLTALGPQRRLQAVSGQLAHGEARLTAAVQRLAAGRRQRWLTLVARLHALSPLAVLTRGYAVVTLEDGRVLRAAAQAPLGTLLTLRLERGQVQAHSQGPKEET